MLMIANTSNKINNWQIPELRPLDFHLPKELEAGAPPEARGLCRDQVRLMVTRRSNQAVIHSQFHHLPDYYEPGDVMVINTSGTLNAALNVVRQDGIPLELHLSTYLPADLWIVELRQPAGPSSEAYYGGQAGERLELPGGGSAVIHTPYRPDQRRDKVIKEPKVRLWIATLDLPEPLDPYLQVHGFPIRYKYVKEAWPNSYYQTVYATEKGSAEMPSAGRAFTPELITRLIAKGVQIAPLILHTGVASLEDHEPPYEEYYLVPTTTAQIVNDARQSGKRVIAVGTTTVRALETVTSREGVTLPGEGWTRLIVTPERGLRAVNGLLTGFHEPRSTHLAMLEALAGRPHLRLAYDAALQHGYLWHEFGDLHLLLP
jgi:S-adenosylmethionine:tRNA ribosyltransferase-isomerase